jgi:ATP-dependent DNA helicase PIF1
VSLGNFIQVYVLQSKVSAPEHHRFHHQLYLEYLEDIQQSCILSPLNSSVNWLNDQTLKIFKPSEPVRTFYSADRLHSESETDSYAPPIEHLNKIYMGSFPLHELKLKIGQPCILIRNCDPSKKLCNGTKLIVKKFFGIDCHTILFTNTLTGKDVFISRMPMEPKDGCFPFKWKRLQFPVVPAFAMTVHKAQGQT